MKNLIIALAATLFLFFSCDDVSREEMLSSNGNTDSEMILQVTPESVARMLSNLPLTLAQISEVKNAVDASSANGYDEEYPFSLVFSSPGTGVGEDPNITKATDGPLSLGNLILERVSGSATRSVPWTWPT